MTLDGFSWNLLAGTAAIALSHTLLGPDHYLPFVMMARAGGWSRARTVWTTVLCGAAHVASSLLLGAAGVVAGLALHRIEGVETRRGSWAAWGMVALGAAYAVWGIRRALRERRGLVLHAHAGERPGVHLHAHGAGAHVHAPDGAGARSRMGFWTLFALFVLGPCEPMIPLFVLPASRGRWGLALGSALLFGVLTVAGMTAVVLAMRAGLTRLPLGPLERWSHAMAGGVLIASGLAVVLLGL